jgi:hypothetical protein
MEMWLEDVHASSPQYLCTYVGKRKHVSREVMHVSECLQLVISSARLWLLLPKTLTLNPFLYEVIRVLILYNSGVA